jgi:uncharacterized protein (TIGR02147 family)
MKSIYEYRSFRTYIRDLFQDEKTSSKHLTLGHYAKQFGFSGPALNLILSGKRNLTVSNLHQVARALRLSKNEREYLEALVLWEQADHEETQAYYASKLKALRKERKNPQHRASDKQLLAGWHIPALLIYLIDFEKMRSFENINFEQIAAKFSISVQEVRRLISLFQKLGLLSIDSEEGAHIVFERVASQVQQKDFYRAAQTEILNRLDQEFANPDALFRATVFTISQKKISEFYKDLLQLLNDYIGDPESQSEDKVLLQGSFGFFPVSSIK